MSLSISDYQLQLEQEIQQIQKTNQEIEDAIKEIWQKTEMAKIEIEKDLSQNEFSGNDNWLDLETFESNIPKLEESEILEIALQIFDLN